MRVIINLSRVSLCLLCIFIFSFVSARTQTTAKELKQEQMVDSGSWYSRVQWPHDGNPYESSNFVVFSDEASLEARRSAAEIGENVLAELVAEFGIDMDKMFRYPASQSKIHIYVYKNKFPQTWGARAYYAGFVIWSLDHEQRPKNLESYKKTIKHELVHIMEALLKGRDVIYIAIDTRVHVWFSEGFGEAVTGGTTGKPVSDLGYLNYLTDKYGRINPVSVIHDGMAGDWSNEKTAAASAAAGSEYYYPMYHLTVKYLIDPDGHGRSLQDVIGVYTDIAAGLDFKTAFENRMGISVKEYKEQYFDLMNSYLNEGESVMIRRVSIVWLFLMAGSLVVYVWLVFHDKNVQWGGRLIWLMATALFGPLGLLTYRLDRSPDGSRAAHRLNAVKSSVITVTRNVTLFVLISAAVIPFLGSTATHGPESFVILFFLVWLTGYAGSSIARSRGWYHSAERSTFLRELISMVLAIVGLFIVFVPLSAYWWSFFDPRSIYFWGLIPIAAIIGVVFVYPYKCYSGNAKLIGCKLGTSQNNHPASH